MSYKRVEDDLQCFNGETIQSPVHILNAVPGITLNEVVHVQLYSCSYRKPTLLRSDDCQGLSATLDLVVEDPGILLKISHAYSTALGFPTDNSS
ncbi:hypothetical protein Tco_0593964 [Tanacetum coccineum]